MTSAELYEKAVELNLKRGSWQSDLYLKRTPDAENLIKNYDFRTNVTTFKSQIDGTSWYDVPFAYTPFWTAKTKAQP